MSKQVLTNPVPTPLNPISFFSGKIKSSFGRLFKKRKDKTNKIPTSAADSMGGRISQKGKDNKVIRSDAAAFMPQPKHKKEKRLEQIKPIPPFKKNKKHNQAEYDRQLKMQ